MRRSFRNFCLCLIAVLGLGLNVVSAAASSGQAADPGARLERMILVLKPSAGAESALDALLTAQQTKGGTQYHQWVTPSAFAASYALDSADMAQVTNWLTSQGFTVATLPAGGGWVEFSGTAAQVESAFGSLLSQSGQRMVADSVTLPAAIAPYAVGVASLDGVLARSAMTRLASGSLSNTGGLLTPSVLSSRYGLSSTAGSSATIAIPARSNLSVEAVASFRSQFALAKNPVAVQLAGADPGVTGDAAEALLDAAWAGVGAPQAKVIVVPAATTAATDGVDLALAAIVDGHLADVVSISYVACEQELSAAHRAFYRALYRQAAAEGMTIIAAAGDSGASACTAAGDSSTGYAVNALAATPWNIAVGGTALGASSESGWQATAASNTAGGGGLSGYYAAPAWQAASNAAYRALPDVSLAAAGAAGGYAFCDTSCASGTLSNAAGTSGATALFAGIFADVVAKNGAQGAAAETVYELSRVAGVYNDVTEGSARSYCAAGANGCGADGMLGYSASYGYDLATGLGSVNAQSFVNQYANVTPLGTGAATVTINTAGQTIYANQAFTISVTVAPTSGSGAVPAGGITIYDQTLGTTVGGAGLNSAGVAAVSLLAGSLPVGTHSLIAQYTGDGNYAAANSGSIQIIVVLVPTTTTAGITTTSISYLGTVSVTATVTPQAITQAMTGSVTFKVDGGTVATTQGAASGNNYVATGQFTASTVGSHTLVATYSGDTDYGTSSSASTTFTVGKGTPTVTLTSSPTTPSAGTPATFTATISASGVSGASFSGTVQFMDGTTALGSPVTVSSNSATSASVTLTTGSSHSITAVYSGDTNWSSATSSALTVSSTSALTTTTTLTANVTTASSSSVIQLTATVAPTTITSTTVSPTGNVIFYDNGTAVGTVALTAATGYTAVATLSLSALTPGTHVFTAVYAGDTTYTGSTSASVTVAIQDFTISSTVVNVNVVRGGTATVPFTVTGYGGFNNEIEITCAAPANSYTTCYFVPNIVYGSGTTSLSIITSGSSTAAMRQPQWMRWGGGAAMACLLLMPVFRRRGARHLRRLAACLLLLLAVAAGTTGCTNSTLPLNKGVTPLGVETLTITAAAVVNNTTVSHRTYLTVTVQ